MGLFDVLSSVASKTIETAPKVEQGAREVISRQARHMSEGFKEHGNKELAQKYRDLSDRLK